MITTTEIIKEACLWWMTFSAVALLLIAFFSLGTWLDKKFPNSDKFLKKILGKRFYNFLKEVL